MDSLNVYSVIFSPVGRLLTAAVFAFFVIFPLLVFGTKSARIFPFFFYIPFAIALSFFGQPHSALTAVFLGVSILLSPLLALPIIESPPEKGGKKRLIAFSALVVFGLYAANLVHYMALIIAAALFMLWGSGRRLEQSGIKKVTTTSYTPAELRYSKIVRVREYFPLYFLLSLLSMSLSGYVGWAMNGLNTHLHYLYWTWQYPVAAFGLVFVQASFLALVSAALIWLSMGGGFKAALEMLKPPPKKQKTVRGAVNSTDLQNHLDQQ
ncbi:membrane hypothetical protein [Thiomonas sp. CB3]|nr:membrane hypothetical protein [Thiomonas sp. CB3]